MAHIHELINSASVRIHVGVYPNVNPELDKEIAIGRALNVSQNIKDDSQIYGVYDEKTQEKAFFEEELINSFSTAIKEKQFKIFYQPKYNIQGERNRLVSAEALIRWIHPKYGMVSPGVFIPLFEENGLIQQLDHYVWEEAARQIREWKDRLGYSVPVSVNVSRIDMNDPKIADNLIQLTEKYGLTGRDILLEVTESAYTQDSDQIIDTVIRGSIAYRTQNQ